MTHLLRSVFVFGLLAVFVVGCTTLTGKTAGENIDDAKITAALKTKLAAEKASTLTKIDVDTNQGTVYLNGTVENAEMKQRATDIARQVAGVREVINNLKIGAAQ